MKGCCDPLDGLAMKIQEPYRADVPNSSTYYNWKGYFALNMQDMCDCAYRFQYVSAVNPRSTQDSMEFAMSGISMLISSQIGSVLCGYWIAVDDAYCCNNWISTPLPCRQIRVLQDSFNYWLYSARIHIEQAFGMLVRRWDILWRPLFFLVAKAA